MIADLSQVDASGDLDSTHSKSNTIVDCADGIFTTLFSIECTLKIIAMGFFGESGAYLMNPWSWVDFIVVFVGYALEFSSLCEPPLAMRAFVHSLCSIVATISGTPNVSGRHAFRVLRPLRLFNAVRASRSS